jgi:hypothetical protein
MIFKMNGVLFKLKQTMADCNRIVAENSIKNNSYENLNNFVENWIKENESSDLCEIHMVEKKKDENKSATKIKKVTQIENKVIQLKKPQNINTMMDINIIPGNSPKYNEINKYSLKHVKFDGRRHYKKLYCILIPKHLPKCKIYEYAESLLKLKSNVHVKISEKESNFYMIKYAMHKAVNFLTIHRFEPTK